VPQMLLPLIPDGANQINDLLSVVQEGGYWTYFLGSRPVFSHTESDLASFRMFTAQLISQGTCRPREIIKAFGVSSNSVNRSVKKYHEEGVQAFYNSRRGRGATVITKDVSEKAQQLLDAGCSRKDIAQRLGIKTDTLRKAIAAGRLHEPAKSELGAAASSVSNKSERSAEDAAAGEQMGTACTRSLERVCAAMGLLPEGAPTRFEPCRDVSFGGVLCALPALIQNGLFKHLAQCFTPLGGYYTTLQVITLLAWMALCRIKTVEQLQSHSPGELGKLLGLDRVPEVRCLRNKLSALSEDNAPQIWADVLSQGWMDADPELAGSLYVDGHVRLYHGKLTKLSRRYVSRQRLCLRGTTDYWVNDAEGKPFFVVERPVNQGILEALESDIVPRLLAEVPNQPSQEEFESDRYLSRFTIIFDREGYSPAFFKKMWSEHRIACITYHKHPRDEWPKDEFVETPLTLVNGEEVTMRLAERGSWIGSRHDGLWVREVRKLGSSGHQTSLVSSAYDQSPVRDSVQLFSRWCQENFFRYAMQHFGIDLLSEYGTEEIAGTNRPVVNPARRELDRLRRSLQSKLNRSRAEYAKLTLHPEADEAKVAKWERLKAEAFEQIEQLEHELETVKATQAETPKHLPWEELPEEAKFEQLAPSRKRLLDTVKMAAYRAETAMSNIVRQELSRKEDSRSLLRELFQTDADLRPSPETDELHIQIHAMSNPRSNRAIEHLLTELNAAEQTYPGTKMKLIYTLVTSGSKDDVVPTHFPQDQEV